MQLSKAIEILERWYAGGFATKIEDMNPAIQLSIEALKRIKSEKDTIPESIYSPLPGESD